MKKSELPAGIVATDERRQIAESVKRICDQFDDEFWLEKENKKEFPHEFHAAMAEAGWLGITMPEEFGGAGLGVTDADHWQFCGRDFGLLNHPYQPVRSTSGG